jgi:ABC-2 type transport system permease protein
VSALVHSELLKFRTTRAWIGFVLALAAISAVASAGTVGSASGLERGTSHFARDVLQSSLFATLIAFIVGITCVTSEWRHGTITRTFLGAPRRPRVLAAKELTVALLSASFAALALVVVLCVAIPWLAVEGSSLGLGADGLPLAVRILAATVLWGALGVGVGAVVQNQTVALVASIIWILLGEALIRVLLDLVDLGGLADYLPGRALSAFDGSVEDGLSMWGAAAVASAWVVALGALGGLRASRQDVT